MVRRPRETIWQCKPGDGCKGEGCGSHEEQALNRYNLRRRARIHHMSVMGDDPIWMRTAPIPACKRAMQRAGMLAEIGYPHVHFNPNGGGISLGHPLGATGARIMTTLLHELERTGGRYGLQTMCEGGGVAKVTIIERMS